MAISSFWKQFESGYFVLSQPTGKVLLLGRHLTSTGLFDKLAILGQPILIGYWQIITYFIVVQIHEISWKIIFLSPIQSYTFTIKHGCKTMSVTLCMTEDAELEWLIANDLFWLYRDLDE